MVALQLLYLRSQLLDLEYECLNLILRRQLISNPVSPFVKMDIRNVLWVLKTWLALH